jgi:Yip1 domain
MNLIARVKDVLLTPKSAWSAISEERANTAMLYRQYIAPLAAIPAVAGFVGTSLIGVGALGVSIRIPIATGLVQMVLGYVMSLAMVYVVALIANALAPGFGGEKHPTNALRLVAYSSTAAMVGGIFALIPALGMLTLVAALYSLYLLFLGGPVLMRVASGKALAYTAVLAVCAIALGAIVGMAVGAMQGATASMASLGATGSMSAPAAQVSIDTPKGMVTVDTAALDAWSKRMGVLGEKLAKAQESGDQAAIDQAFNEMNELQKTQPLAR